MEVQVDPHANVDSVLDIKYMRVIRWLLRSMSAWPHESFEEPAPSHPILEKTWFLCEILPCITFQVLYLLHNEFDFIIFGHTTMTLLISILVMTRFFLSWTKKFAYSAEMLCSKIHLFHHRNKSHYAMKIHLKINKFSTLVVYYLPAHVFIGALMFNLTPLYNNYASGMLSSNKPANISFEYSVFYHIPEVDVYRNFNAYLVVSIMNVYISIHNMMLVLITDLILCFFIFHIYGHLEILRNEMETFPRPGEILKEEPLKQCGLMFSAKEMSFVLAKLKEIADYYLYIKKFTQCISDTYEFAICFCYLFHLIADCVLLLQCTQEMDVMNIVRYIPLTLFLYMELFQLSFTFELMGTASEKLINATYGLPWECMDSDCRKVVYIMLYQVQKPIKLKALGLTEVGVQTMASVMKTTFSYYTMLRTFSK